MTRKSRFRNAIVPASSVGPVHLKLSQVGPLTMTEMEIDFSKADVPERSYFADHCDVKKARTGTCLLFGKLTPGSTHLRTQVEIDFPDIFFMKQLWASTREMNKLLESGRSQLMLEPIGEVVGTDKVQAFRSNNVFVGIWGEEAVMDFYYLSPREVFGVHAGAQSAAALEPVLRIVMSSALLLEFLDKCKNRAGELEVSHEEVITT